jgi:mRNA deadenylase 3'-5' endonuclease subunit Ccr4
MQCRHFNSLAAVDMMLLNGHSRLVLILVSFLLAGTFAPGLCLSQGVSLVTWNLLAPLYARESKYPWSKQHLDWSLREPKIIEQLALIDADIICLQEIQVDLWDHFSSQLQELGYHDGVLQEMGRRHPVANAILVRQGLSILRTESRSRALIAVILDEEKSSSPLYLANVHLDAGCTEDADVTRLNQVRSLCKRLKNQISKDISLKASSDSPIIVITGDCNVLRGSPLYTLLKTGSTRDPSGNEITVPYLLPLHDAYLNHPPPWGPDVRMSYRSGHLLDYVWVSDAIDVLRTMPVANDTETVEPKDWPSAKHPSDHIPIGAILSWPGAPVLSNSERSGWQQLQDTIDDSRETSSL